MPAPKKLIRSNIISKLKEGEWEEINDIDELNKLYAIKIREELAEIQQAEHKDVLEFADLIEVCYTFAEINNFARSFIDLRMFEKRISKGNFGRLVLNNLNPSNPSNALYFEKPISSNEINSGIFDKNKIEIKLGDTIKWKHFDGHTKLEDDYPSEKEFQVIQREVIFKKGSFGVQITEDHFQPFSGWMEEDELFYHTYFGSTGESMHVTVNCDFEII